MLRDCLKPKHIQDLQSTHKISVNTNFDYYKWPKCDVCLEIFKTKKGEIYFQRGISNLINFHRKVLPTLLVSPTDVIFIQGLYEAKWSVNAN